MNFPFPYLYPLGMKVKCHLAAWSLRRDLLLRPRHLEIDSVKLLSNKSCLKLHHETGPRCLCLETSVHGCTDILLNLLCSK